MRTKNSLFASLAVAAVAALVSTTPASAQLANASAATLGLAGNQTATARGFAAISVNPAGLAMPGSGFSLALVPVQVRAGIDPIGLKDFKDVQGDSVVGAIREDWFRRITDADGQSGSVGLDLTEIALTIGSIGLQVSTVVSANMNLGPGVMEAVLYGNADPTGQPKDVTLAGSTFDGFAVTTAALSIARSLPSVAATMAVGATLKYSVGHGIASGRASGVIQGDPVRVQLDMPMIHTDGDDYQPFGNGSGIGLDLGFQLESGPLHLGVALQNVMNSFAWDESTLVYRPGSALLELGNNETSFDTGDYAQAPADLRAVLDDMTFKPTLAVGGAFDFPMALTVSADLRTRLGEGGIELGPKFNLGAGAEWRGLRIIHLRAGGAVVTGGVQYGAGASIVLGPLNLTAGVGTITGEEADTGIAHFAFSLGNR